jgi:RNA polymerase sigma-70 factor, ECF subfamily
MNFELSVRDEMLIAVPSLRAFALSLTNDRSRADDRVQGTLMRALTFIDQYKRGTNLEAWLFTILRNLFRSEYRTRRREVDDPNGFHAARLKTAPDQLSHLDYEDLRSALARLSREHREALLLVTAEGLSYGDAAAVCGTAVGTIKSRVNRARLRLTELLELDQTDHIGPDSMTKAALQESP